jgi:hypothetical protein
LAREDASGGHTILGSSNDPAQIDAVAASVARGNITRLPPNLRLLVEIIRTQVFPPHALAVSPDQRAKWVKAHYLDRSDLCEQDLKKGAA